MTRRKKAQPWYSVEDIQRRTSRALCRDHRSVDLRAEPATVVFHLVFFVEFVGVEFSAFRRFGFAPRARLIIDRGSCGRCILAPNI